MRRPGFHRPGSATLSGAVLPRAVVPGAVLSGAALVAALVAPAAAGAVDLPPLLAPAELAALQAEQDLVVLDIRNEAEAYAAGHVPGAISAPYGAWRGPAENPGQLLTDAELTDLVQRLGLEAGDAVVVTYRGETVTDFGAAARVYWTLKSIGFEELSILNGGLAAWTEAGYDLSTEAVTLQPSDLTVTLANDWLATRDDVQAIVDGEQEAVLVDARPQDFYDGQTQHPAAVVPGTIPQAQLFTHSNWFDGDSPTIIEAEAAERLAAEAGYGPETGTLVSFCNTGHWAATNWFALSELAGLDTKLYPESVVGWSNAGLPLQNVPDAARAVWERFRAAL